MTKNNKIIYIALAAVCIISVIVFATVGFTKGQETGGKTEIEFDLPSDVTSDDFDTDELKSVVSGVIAENFTMSVADSYSASCLSVYIEIVPAADIGSEADDLLSAVNEAYPDWEIESVNKYTVAGSTDASDIWCKVAVIDAAAVVLAFLYEVFKGKKFSLARPAAYILNTAVVEIISLLLAMIAGVEFGWKILLVVFVSVAFSAIVLYINMEYVDRMKQASKGERELASLRAQNIALRLGLSSTMLGLITYCAAEIAGMLAGASFSNVALSFALPAFVCGIESQFISQSVYGDCSKIFNK